MLLYKRDEKPTVLLQSVLNSGDALHMDDQNAYGPQFVHRKLATYDMKDMLQLSHSRASSEGLPVLAPRSGAQ